VKKSSKKWPNPFLSKVMNKFFHTNKVTRKIRLLLSLKTTKSKQAQDRRKLAQSVSNPTIAIAVKIYNATDSLVRFENKKNLLPRKTL
jgi:hypothetical protein